VSADDDRKPLPKPFGRKPWDLPAPATAAEVTPPPEVEALTVVDAPPVVEPPPLFAPDPLVTTGPGTEVVDAWPLTMRLPPWLQSRRVRIGLGVTAAIFLIGIIAAFAADDPPSKAAVAMGGAERDAGAGVAAAPHGPDATPSEPAADEEEPEADDETIEPDEEPPPVKKKASPRKRTTSKPAPAAKKSSSGRQVRLTVKTEPAGASVRVDGEELRGGEVMVRSGSTVKVTATKKGYKRVTKSVKVTKATPIVIKLKKL
jgi:hypothetical protein